MSYLIDEITTRDADDALGGYEARLSEVQDAYRLQEGGVWPSGAAPAGYAELREEYYRAWGELFAQRLKEFGEPEMARLFRQEHDQFEQLTEEGRQYFFGPMSLADVAPIVWLNGLVEAAAGCMTADSPTGPLGYRYCDEEGPC